MTPLSIVILVAAVVGLLVFLPSALAPERFAAWAAAFPRSTWPGRILLLIEMPWAAYVLVQDPPFAGNAMLIKLIYGLAPVAMVLILWYLDELLSARAVGGLLLLAAHPVLATARWHPSDLTVVVKVLAYLWVIAGMVLVVSPFRLRHTMDRWTATPQRSRIIGWAGSLASLGLVVLALVAYR